MCYLVQAEAAKNPSLEVDRAPDLAKSDPMLLRAPKGGYPKGFWRKDGTAKVKVSVAVDTVGKAVMPTYTVIESTHPWMGENIKSRLPLWTFTPAVKNGCNVMGLWVFTANLSNRKPRK